MMCKNQHGRPTILSLMEDLKGRRVMKQQGNTGRVQAKVPPMLLSEIGGE
jgi:hypothetical protein